MPLSAPTPMHREPEAPLQHLDNVLAHPVELAFAGRLHRDSRPAQGQWRGQVQHLASGERASFSCPDELCDWIATRFDHARAGER